MDFNHWDIILFVPLAYAAWKGFRRGFVVEVASVVGLIAGIYIAANFSDIAAGYLKSWLNIEGTWLDYSAFLATFVGVVFGVYALAKIVEKAVHLVAMKLLNKLLGALFGVLKMALILSVVLNLLSWLDMHIPVLSKSAPDKSLLFQPIQIIAPKTLPILTSSEWMKDAEGAFYEVLEPTNEG